VNVIFTDLTVLRDSNLLYSALWRTCFQWFGNSRRGGVLPHPFSGQERHVTLRSYLRLLNFKANHRKVVLADDGDMVTVALLSANSHDASSAHSNTGIVLTGKIGLDVLDSERAVASFSGYSLQTPELRFDFDGRSHDEPGLAVTLLGERAIRDGILEMIDTIGSGDTLLMVMFYLSERDVIQSLLRAAERGADIRIILDPTKDAFGHEKNGIPNR